MPIYGYQAPGIRWTMNTDIESARANAKFIADKEGYSIAIWKLEERVWPTAQEHFGLQREPE